MTQTLKTAALIIFATVAALTGIVINTHLADLGAERLVPAMTEVAPQMGEADAVPAVDGTETLSLAQLEVAMQTADRVCEGAWAGVPVNEMAAQVAAIGGMSTEAATAWVNDVITTECTRTVATTP
jgi:hypothetical protein